MESLGCTCCVNNDDAWGQKQEKRVVDIFFVISSYHRESAIRNRFPNQVLVFANPFLLPTVGGICAILHFSLEWPVKSVRLTTAWMVKKEVQEYTYEHPWEVVTEASLRKYPNRWCPQVQRVETLKRTVDSNGRLLSRRLFQGTNPVPSWLHWLIGSEPAYAVEDSVIDSREKTMVLCLRSLSLRNLVE